MTNQNDEYFAGLIIAGSAHEISQAITKIIAAGFTFEFYYDPQYIGDAVIVIDPNTPELEAPGLVDAPPVEEVAPEPEPTVADPTPEPTPEEQVAEDDGLPPVDAPVDAPAPAPVKRTRKPKAAPAEETPAAE